MTTNKLKLNTDKTELLILYSRFRLPPRLPSIKIGTDIIKPTNKARYIGVIFDNTVTMSFHNNNIVKVAFYHLRNIAKIRKYINVTTAEVPPVSRILNGSNPYFLNLELRVIAR